MKVVLKTILVLLFTAPFILIGFVPGCIWELVVGGFHAAKDVLNEISDWCDK